MKKHLVKLTSLLIFVATNCALAVASQNDAAIAGPDNAQITIEEFADFNCSYCAKAALTMKEVLKSYAGKVKLVFRNAPLPGHGANSLNAAKAFAAVYLQSQSVANSFQEQLFAHQDQLISEGEPFLYETAEKLGININQMKEDMNGEAVAKSLATDQQLWESHHFTGTPSFMIGSKAMTGARSFEAIKKIIDGQLDH